MSQKLCMNNGVNVDRESNQYIYTRETTNRTLLLKSKCCGRLMFYVVM